MAPDPSLIEARSDYDALNNVTHRASVALPYYTPSNGDIGLSGVTSWTEPLGAHTLNAVGSLSLTQPGTRSEVVASYLNRQFEPTVGLTVFSASSSARIYGSNLLVEDRTGGDLTARWPLDWRVRPYVSTSVSARLRYADLDPLTPSVFAALPDGLAPPQAGQQASLRLQFTRRKRPPYRHTLVHPLDGWGLRLRATGAAEVLGGDSSFLRGDVAGYAVCPGIGNHRLYLYGRLQAQTGASFPQDYVGFSRYDAIDLPLPGAVPFSLATPSGCAASGSTCWATGWPSAVPSTACPLRPVCRPRCSGSSASGTRRSRRLWMGAWCGGTPIFEEGRGSSARAWRSKMPCACLACASGTPWE